MEDDKIGILKEKEIVTITSLKEKAEGLRILLTDISANSSNLKHTFLPLGKGLVEDVGNVDKPYSSKLEDINMALDDISVLAKDISNDLNAIRTIL
jgi:hypothetical protein